VINLLPPDIKKETKFARINVALMQYLLLIIVVGVALSAIMIFGGRIVASNENSLEDNISLEQDKAQELSSINDEARVPSEKIDTIGTLLAREIKFSDLLREIGSLMPKGSILTNLAISEESQDDPLLLDASVVDEDTAAILRENLVNSNLFTNADIVSITLSDTPNSGEDGQVYRFNAKFQAFFVDTSPPAETETPPGGTP